MGWSDCGTDSKGRPIGYAHRAICDHPGCKKKIDRGLAYACGGMHGENEGDCEDYFCDEHLFSVEDPDERLHSARLCEACKNLWNEHLVEDLVERVKELEAEQPEAAHGHGCPAQQGNALPSPASKAYRLVEAALSLAVEELPHTCSKSEGFFTRFFRNPVREKAKEALTALPALKPQAQGGGTL